MHAQSHPLAGKTAKIGSGSSDPAQNLVVPGAEYKIEDWWDKLTGKSWMISDGNFACLHYAMRSASCNLPIDDEVVYGKIGNLSHLVHVSELEWDE